jgi:hypothetical protein
MSTIKETGLKVVICGAMALAMSFSMSWAFVDSGAALHWSAASSSTHLVAGTAGSSSTRLAQAGTTGLLQ